MKENKKLLVTLLVWLLILTSFAALIRASYADNNFTQITLVPQSTFNIGVPGNYQLTGSWLGDNGVTALVISSSDVIVNGQNFLLQGDASTVIQVLPTAANVTLENMNEAGASIGLDATSGSNFTIVNCSFSNNSDYGAVVDSASNFALQNLTLDSNGNSGLSGVSASNFAIQNLIAYNNTLYGFTFLNADLFEISNSQITYNYYGLYGNDSSDFTIVNSNLSNNGDGSRLSLCSNFTFSSCNIANNNLVGLHTFESDNVTVNDNTITNNGNAGYFNGGLELGDSNVTATNNLITANYDGLIWAPEDNLTSSTLVFTNNTFENNLYTFFLAYLSTLPNQQLYFYNNLVDDYVYLDPAYLNHTYNLPAADELYLNTTLQLGTRVWSSGDMIGGNFWAHPDGSGFSQTGSDPNHTGFVNLPFDPLGNHIVYDYHPYSSNYLTTLTYTGGTSQTITARQISSEISVEILDPTGNPETLGATVSLSSTSNSGTFYSDANGNNPITSITIPQGSNTCSFYYIDTSAGTPTLSAISQGSTNATTQFTINPHSQTIDHLTIIPKTSSVTVGASQTYSTNAYDQYGNSWSVTAYYTVNGTAITGNSVTENAPGLYNVTATYAGKTDNASLTVNPALDHFTLTVPQNATADSAFSIGIAAYYTTGNLDTTFTGTVNLSSSLGTTSPTITDAFAAGIWNGSVTLSTAGLAAITASDVNGHSGTSANIEVYSPTPTPTPTPTPSPTATPTPTSITNPTPYPTAIPTPIPNASTPTPSPTTSLSQTPTQTPTSTNNESKNTQSGITTTIVLAIIALAIVASAIAVILYMRKSDTIKKSNE